MKTKIVNSIFGQIEAYEGDLITEQIIEFGAHTRPELAFFLNMVREGDNVFDIGAHIGTFTIPIANKIGVSGKLLAVEGNPETYAVLKNNLRMTNNLWVKAFNNLIAQRGVKLTPNYVNNNTGAGYYLFSEADNAVDAVGLDEIITMTFSPRIVKIDIEGFEYLALLNAPNLFELKPIFYMEVSKQQLARCGSSISQLDDLLSKNGYKLFRNVGDRNASHDNFIVSELNNLSEGGEFFDVLAIHEDDERLSKLK